MMAGMSTEMSRDDAAAALEKAGRAAETVRKDTRWVARYFAVLGVGFGAGTLILGSIPDQAVRMSVFGAIWIAFVVTLLSWSRRQRSAPTRMGRRIMPGIVGTSALFAVALVAGLDVQTGNWLYWVPVSVVVALPLLVNAWWLSRR
jgi:hypothetical protein